MKIDQYVNTKNILPAICLFFVTVISINLFPFLYSISGNPFLRFLNYGEYFIYLFMFLTTIAFVKKVEKTNVKQLFKSLGYVKTNFRKSIGWALLFILIYLSIVIGSIFIFNLNFNTEFNKWYQTRFSRLYAPSFIFGIFFGSGFVEETAFRGYILTRLVPKGKLTIKKAILPILIAGFLHAAWHWPFGFYEPTYWGLANNIGSMLVSLVTGFIMLRTRNIFGASLFHILGDIL